MSKFRCLVVLGIIALAGYTLYLVAQEIIDVRLDVRPPFISVTEGWHFAGCRSGK
jgi:hypothetical protein